MSMMSVVDAATEIGVTPARVRQLIAAGALAADRVGGRWVISEMAVESVHPRSAGRPWDSAAAWGLLWVGLGRPVPWLSVKQHQRAVVRMRAGISAHVGQLRSRAESDEFVGHPVALGRLCEESRIVVSGIALAGSVGADLVGGGEEFEGYVKRRDLARVVKAHGLVAAGGRPGNVVLHVVDDPWPFARGEREAPVVVVALDLVERNDERVRRAGLELLEHAVGVAL